MPTPLSLKEQQALNELEVFEASKIRDVTVVHPIAVAALVITIILMVSLPRRKVLIPFFLMAILIPLNQRIAIVTLDFYFVRILIIIGWIRILVRSELYFGNSIDKIFASTVFSSVIASIILWQSLNSAILGFAQMIDILGSYVLIRSLIRDFDDIDLILNLFVFISIALAGCMIIEQVTHKNIFYIFGGVPEFTFLRDNRFRSQGSFGHPILAGTFGAVMLPSFIYLWSQKKINRLLAIVGICSTAVIVFTSSSSGPVFAYMGAIMGLLLFYARRHMRAIKWGVLFIVVAVHFAMNAPIWALIGRSAVFGASTAYHRYTLVDQFIRRFGEWWLLGTKSTIHWSEHLSTWDVANQYVKIGTSGGAITLILFFVLIFLCFNSMGKGIKIFEQTPERLFLYWAAGAMLFTHLVAFMGVSYFGQIFLLWTLTISIISTLSDLLNSTHPDQVG